MRVFNEVFNLFAPHLFAKGSSRSSSGKRGQKNGGIKMKSTRSRQYFGDTTWNIICDILYPWNHECCRRRDRLFDHVHPAKSGWLSKRRTRSRPTVMPGDQILHNAAMMDLRKITLRVDDDVAIGDANAGEDLVGLEGVLWFACVTDLAFKQSDGAATTRSGSASAIDWYVSLDGKPQ